MAGVFRPAYTPASTRQVVHSPGDGSVAPQAVEHRDQDFICRFGRCYGHLHGFVRDICQRDGAQSLLDLYVHLVGLHRIFGGLWAMCVAIDFFFAPDLRRFLNLK